MHNLSLWPAALLLWAVTAVAALCWARRRLRARPLFALLALHWAWSAIVYHWIFFRPINPAAAVFSMLFIVQAAFFGWLAANALGRSMARFSLRGTVGGLLIAYGLVYPLLGVVFGLTYPRLPLFAVPCPTTLVTAGFLVTAVAVPRWVNVLPIVWSVIGSSAAFALGIRADLALVVTGAVLALDTVAPSALGARE